MDIPPVVAVLKDCRRGRMLYFPHDFYIGKALDVYKEFCEIEGDLFGQLLRPGQTVVEAGANIGAHTVHLGQLVGPEGRVIALEPQRVVFQLLCANAMLNNLLNVYPYHAGAGDVPGTMKVPFVNYAALGNFGALSLRSAGEGEDVPIITVDALNLSALHLLKVDVEGMEINVLKGARNSIAKYRPVMYVENDRRDKSGDLLREIESLGYKMYWHLPPLFNPDNFAGIPDNIYPGIVSINLLCLPNELAIEMTGFTAVSDPSDWPLG